MMNKLEFTAGDFVVYPAHGVGRVEGIETHHIAGQTVTLYAITFEKERMTLKVPVGKAKDSGLRRLSSKDRIKVALDTLQGRSRARRAMWSRRAQEYEAKITLAIRSRSRKSSATFIAAATSPTSPIASARFIRPPWSGWPVNWPPSRRSTRARRPSALKLS